MKRRRTSPPGKAQRRRQRRTISERLLSCLLSLAALGSWGGELASAQTSGRLWTVQTAAFEDYRQATAQVEQLEGLGFDAYSEFSMHQGTQYTRVRIGCFASREAAAGFSRVVAGTITAEAVPQPLSEGAPVESCTRWDVGFIKPTSWRVERTGSDILFAVEVGGHAGYVQHDGDGWHFGHRAPDAEPSDPPQQGRFRQLAVAGQEFVQTRLEDGRWIHACTGELLWQAGDVAVVERPTAVIACVVDER